MIVIALATFAAVVGAVITMLRALVDGGGIERPVTSGPAPMQAEPQVQVDVLR